MNDQEGQPNAAPIPKTNYDYGASQEQHPFDAPDTPASPQVEVTPTTVNNRGLLSRLNPFGRNQINEASAEKGAQAVSGVSGARPRVETDSYSTPQVQRVSEQKAAGLDPFTDATGDRSFTDLGIKDTHRTPPTGQGDSLNSTIATQPGKSRGKRFS